MGSMIVRINPMNRTVSPCVVISTGLEVKSTKELVLKRPEVSGRRKLGESCSSKKEFGKLEMANQPLLYQVQIQSVQKVRIICGFIGLKFTTTGDQAFTHLSVSLQSSMESTLYSVSHTIDK